MPAAPTTPLQRRRQAAYARQRSGVAGLFALALGLAVAVPLGRPLALTEYLLHRASRGKLAALGPGAMAYGPYAPMPGGMPLGNQRYSAVWTQTEELAADKLSGGLMVLDLVPGRGPKLTKGKIGVYEYEAWQTSGFQFDSTMSPRFHRQKPFETPFPGKMFAGWNRGVEGMQVGGYRKLFIPAMLTVTESGSPLQIPRGDLIFEIQLIAVKDP